MSTANGSGNELLRVEGLQKYFPVTRGLVFQKEVGSVKAVDGVNFSLRRGETLGVVGESGCGKSTMARCIARLLEPTGGSITFEGRDITHLDRSRHAAGAARHDDGLPGPVRLAEPAQARRLRSSGSRSRCTSRHRHGAQAPRPGAARDRRPEPGALQPLPHEFSGGQRQRIGIARALAINPKLIICDEPVSALDVSVQAQILNLLKDLQDDFGLTYIFIAHDLNVVRHISDRVMVMYLGRAVELGARDDLYREPKHPYTGALLSAVPIADPEPGRPRKQIILEGDVPSPLNPPEACRFHPRCPRFVDGKCNVDTPS